MSRFLSCLPRPCLKDSGGAEGGWLPEIIVTLGQNCRWLKHSNAVFAPCLLNQSNTKVTPVAFPLLFSLMAVFLEGDYIKHTSFETAKNRPKSQLLHYHPGLLLSPPGLCVLSVTAYSSLTPQGSWGRGRRPWPKFDPCLWSFIFNKRRYFLSQTHHIK